jgi:hypothetical protein
MTLKSNRINFKDEKIRPYQKNYKSDQSGLTKEQILFNEINTIAHELIQVELEKKQFANIILKNLDHLDFSEFISYPKYSIKENYIKKDVESANIRGLNVVSVDGSSVIKKFMNVDFSFLKAIAVKYHFYENHSANIEYFPDLSGFNNYSVQGNYINRNDKAVDSKVSMDMTFMEIRLLNKMIKKHNDIDLIIIDGSILPMPINYVFSHEYELSKYYNNLLKEYRNLYSNCRENGVLLIGSIKDTRTSALSHLIRESIQMLKPTDSNLSDFLKVNYRHLFDYFSDLDLYNRLLNNSERSCIFICKREIEKIRDTGIKKEIPYYFPFDFYAFYLKTANYDTPCRIEFFMEESDSFDNASKKADLISSILLPISTLNEYYGLPIPQIEAHKRAVFKPSEISLLFNTLKRTLNKNGYDLLEKRRNRRPF